MREQIDESSGELASLIRFLSHSPSPEQFLRHICHNGVISPRPRGGAIAVVNDRAEMVELGTYGLTRPSAFREARSIWEQLPPMGVLAGKKTVKLPVAKMDEMVAARGLDLNPEPWAQTVVIIPAMDGSGVPVGGMTLLFDTPPDQVLTFHVGFEIFRDMLTVALGSRGFAREERKRSDQLYRLDHPLTDRERDVMVRITRGKSNKEIAAELSIGVSTVKRTVATLTDKLDVESRSDIGPVAMRYGLLD